MFSRKENINSKSKYTLKILEEAPILLILNHMKRKMRDIVFEDDLCPFSAMVA